MLGTLSILTLHLLQLSNLPVDFASRFQVFSRQHFLDGEPIFRFNQAILGFVEEIHGAYSILPLTSPPRRS